VTDPTPISAVDPPREVAGTRFRVEIVPETGSTNADLISAAARGERPGLVRVANHQTAGRGRLDRQWESAPGASLLVSVLLEPLAPEVIHRVVGAVALSLAEALRALVDADVRIKWPNDLVVGDRKLAGVLAESAVAGGEIRALVVGVGCNLTPDAIAPNYAATAIDVQTATGRVCDRNALLDAFLRRLDHRLGGLDHIDADIAAQSATLGRRVLIELPDGTRTGVATALLASGALVVTDDDGVAHEIVVGDIVHLRHAD